MKKTLNAALATLVFPVIAEATTITFDDLALAPNSHFDPDVTTTFVSGGATFDHNAPYGPCCWSSFTYSNRTDTTTPGYTNDASAITGDGVGTGQENYGVAYDNATVRFGSQTLVQSGYFTNTTYGYLAMANGDDGNATPFVKGPFTDGDFFKVIINGLDAGDQVISTMEIFLAEDANVIDVWTLFDLSILGSVYGLNFTMDSSDPSPFGGINTPAYFALDNLQVSQVPVPAAAWMFGSALLGLVGVGRKRQA